ncbi:hypothetical protein E1B28_004289 [Marasmius oreades]|uniref:VTT domain-containing protein n=1 Tax=Marasmius oreades TaxID=181124 RepID=A0A9P8ACX4_9AGAR|nr:uncharacterized protein E1B28_004289 [Marasmius oreades]KAG7096883.1 hypothetical protein E1B28_004289 [Marasmius oreades]
MSSFSRLVQWFHLHPSHLVFINWSRSSAHPSDDDSLALPLPASATKTSFGDVFDEKLPGAAQHHRFLALPSAHFPVFLVLTLLPVSTCFVYLSLRTLPISVSWPHTITDIAQLGRELHGYSHSGLWPLAHVIAVMAVSAVWKHAWSIPGSVVWNVIAGALFSPALATILLTFLTTLGSICATLLAAPLAPFLSHFFPKALEMTRLTLEGDAPTDPLISSTPSSSHPSGAWVRLSILRLVGVVPWSGINIACGVCQVPLVDCFLGAFIGTLPWTAVTCQIGDILQTVASTPSPTPQTVSSLLLSPNVIFKLILLSFLSLAPILAKDRLKALASGTETPSHTAGTGPESEKDSRMRSWVKRWKVRLPSRSRTRTSEEERLQLVDEKRQMEERLEMLPP